MLNSKQKKQIADIKATTKNQIIFGNWKMNKKYSDIFNFSKQINKAFRRNKILAKTNDIVGIAPTYIGILPASGLMNHDIKIIAQNVHHQLEGAYTGSVSPGQLSEFNIKYVIIGHSEVRQYNYETNKLINEKIDLLLGNKMIPILCVGESLKEYETHKTIEVVREQITIALKDISPEKAKNIIVAYEPIWAIGTGKTATNDVVESTCQEIRKILEKILTEKIAKDMKIIYGGSVKDSNAKSILELPNVDGVLVGGASLDAKSFYNIVCSTKQYQLISKIFAKKKHEKK